ncbi:DUF5908 family protein [Hymenobacter glaciei]
MPIEIRELVIKVTVYEDSRRPTPAAAAFNAEAREQLRQELTESCVREVLAQLRRQRER